MDMILSILLLPIVSYLALAGIYQLTLAIASQSSSNVEFNATDKQNKFLVLVPAYQEDHVIIKSTKKNLALKYEYHRDLFDYVVVADGLQEKTKMDLRRLGAKVHDVSFEKSTKVKSLQSAMNKYDRGYDAVVVLDADNVVNPSFLAKANHYLNHGYCAIQGQRIAANNQSIMALLDGFSETANNAMLCKGANKLGLSSKLSGSGMAFTFDLFQSIVARLEAIGGFDKEMELRLTSNNIYIKYAEDLLVSDEKVATYAAYAKQRGRWLESQYSFFRKQIKPALISLKEGKTDYMHKTLQLALPPRALAPFALLIMSIIGYWLHGTLFTIALTGFLANIASYLITLPKGPLLRYSWTIFKAMPALFRSTIGALFWMKRSKTEFLHTRHSLAQP
ncbi:MAG: glycosyltransferase family 2 protein [Roseivirga sp.]|nr:glycosyltransferase family 2 protein [Roseivirga sp.]